MTAWSYLLKYERLPEKIRAILKHNFKEENAMFRTILSVCLLFVLVLPAWGKSTSNPLPDYEKQALTIWERAATLEETPSPSTGLARSPAEIREELAQYQAEVDVLLNKAWREVSANMKKADATLAGLLLSEQRAWLKFAESFCDKAQDHFGEGGTMYLTIAMYAKLNLWVERISYFRIINRQLVVE